MVHLLAALSWEPQIKGALYVAIAVAVLCGSVQLLLSTNLGARMGFQAAAAGLFGFLTLIGTLWWVYAIGPKGTAPSWQTQEVLAGDAVEGIDVGPAFPAGWKALEAEDPDVADAAPVVGEALTGGEEGGGVFSTASDYVVSRAYETGGGTYGPLGLDFRPFDLFHEARYLVVEVAPVPPEPAEEAAAGDQAAGDQAAGDQASPDEASPDQASPDQASPDQAPADQAQAPADQAPADQAASADQAAPADRAAGDQAPADQAGGGDQAPADQAAGGEAAGGEELADSYAVVMVRDLGSVRLNPAVFTIVSFLLFGLFTRRLHLRDRRAMAAAAEAARAEAEREPAGAGA